MTKRKKKVAGKRLFNRKSVVIAMILLGTILITGAVLAAVRVNSNKKDTAQSTAIQESEPEIIYTYDKNELADKINKYRKSKNLGTLNHSEKLTNAAKVASVELKKVSSRKQPINNARIEQILSSVGYDYAYYSYYYAWSGQGIEPMYEAIRKAGNSEFISDGKMTDQGVYIFDAEVNGKKIKIAFILFGQPNNAYPASRPSVQSYDSPTYDYSHDDEYNYDYPEIETPTYEAPSESTPSTDNDSPSYSYDDAQRIARMNCSRLANTSAYATCVSAYMRKFGY